MQSMFVVTQRKHACSHTELWRTVSLGWHPLPSLHRQLWWGSGLACDVCSLCTCALHPLHAGTTPQPLLRVQVDGKSSPWPGMLQAVWCAHRMYGGGRQLQDLVAPCPLHTQVRPGCFRLHCDAEASAQDPWTAHMAMHKHTGRHLLWWSAPVCSLTAAELISHLWLLASAAGD